MRSNACTIYPSTGRRPLSAGKADIFRRRLFEALEIWYASFPVCRTRGCSLLVERSRASAGSEQLDDPKAKEQASGPASGAVADHPAGRRALWCLINEWLLRIHRVVGQSVVLAALKQHALKQQASKQQPPAFRSGRTEKYWHILNNFEQF